MIVPALVDLEHIVASIVTLTALTAPLPAEGGKQRLPAPLNEAFDRRQAIAPATSFLTYIMYSYWHDSEHTLEATMTDRAALTRSQDSNVRSKADDMRWTPAPNWKPSFFLERDDEFVWHRTENSPFLARYPRESGQHVIDPRSFGFSPYFSFRPLGRTVQDLLGDWKQAKVMEDRTSDGSHRLRLQYADRELEWIFDPARGNQPIRCAVNQQGVARAYVEVDLAVFEGQWLPAAARFYSGSGTGGLEFSVVVHDWKIRDPQLSSELTPNDLGIDSGWNVEIYDNDRRQIDLRIWTGHEAVPMEDYSRMIRSGETTRGELWKALMRHLDEQKAKIEKINAEQGTAARWRFHPSVVQYFNMQAADAARAKPPANSNSPLDGHLSKWREYVESTILLYKLTDEQSEKARALLAECEQLARSRVQSHADELGKLSARIEELNGRDASTAQLSDEQRAAALKIAQAQLESLLLPVHRIFKDRLQPRIDNLPTPAQKEPLSKLGE
jgi:hypothetical protein